MFTGIIQSKGSVKDLHASEKGIILEINSNSLDLSDCSIGDSIAVNGVCLTVTKLKVNSFISDVSQETLNCTTFSELKKGQNVNLEKSLRLNQGIDGHIVSGHIDGVGELISLRKEGVSNRLKIKVKNDLTKYIAKKGAICINGVSLTVVNSKLNQFSVAIIPYTYNNTTFKTLKVGDKANLEFDVIGKYVKRLNDLRN